MLKALPVSVLKLDGMFFRTAKDDEQAKIVIRNIMRMAGELKMATVAEGVETHEQVAFLETTGCDIIKVTCSPARCPQRNLPSFLPGRVGTRSVDRKKGGLSGNRVGLWPSLPRPRQWG